MGQPGLNYDVILERCINHSRAVSALRILNDWGIPTVNTYEVAEICGNKLLTTSALIRTGVPSPRTVVAFTAESALQAIEEMGYPVVLKPAVGSWGRLLCKINDREAAETVLEHKQVLGSYHHSIFYIQEYIHKPMRDIRAFVVGDETICAIYRDSDALDHQHRARRPGHQLPGHARAEHALAWPRRRRSAAAWWPSTCWRTPIAASWSTKSTTPWSSATASTPPAWTSPTAWWTMSLAVGQGRACAAGDCTQR